MVNQRLLVLGGSSFVGRALVAEGLRRGMDVTTFNRGVTPASDDERITRLIGDRTDPATLAALDGLRFDVVADTWSGAPTAVRDSADTLAQRAGRYVYISSCSVYGAPPPIGATEETAPVEADPDAPAREYPADKRGAELAAQRAFGDRALLLRPGLILGPHEDVGRLVWWLARIARGGEVLAPGPPDAPLQLIDARDLAAFALDAALAGESGPFNAISRPGHTTIGALLSACVDAAGGDGDGDGTRLAWVDPDAILAAQIEPWQDLPIWIPPGHPYRGLHETVTDRAHAAGLRCRPAAETVADTWAWMSSLPGAPPGRPDLPAPGLDPERERALLRARR